MAAGASNEKPFISFPDGSSVSRSEIIRTGKLLPGAARKFGVETTRPVAFSAKEPHASAWIAACWSAGIPYWVIPVDALPEQSTDVIRPLFRLYDSIDFSDSRFGSIPKFHISELHKPDRIDSPNPDAVIPDHLPFCYITTSGTSGSAKTLMLRRSQMLEAARAARPNYDPQSGTNWVLALPLNHIGGASVVLRSWIYGLGVFDYRNVHFDEVVKLLSTHDSAAHISLVPTQLRRWVHSIDHHTNHALKTVLLGGGPSDPEMILNARSAGIPVMKSYGMTETCAQICAVPREEINTANPASSGKIQGDNEIKIADEKGNPYKPGNTGMIWLRGKQVITKYLHPTEANRAFDENGWFNTGDFGFLDENGYLFVEMRRDDLIISGGENVNPAEVEAELIKLPGVTDAAVIGTKDPEWGQRVTAYVACPEELFTPDTWKQVLRESLSPYQIPRDFHRLDSIPKTETGKIKRAVLRRMD